MNFAAASFNTARRVSPVVPAGSFILPRDHHPKDQFRLVWIRAPLEVCRSRDPKGLYRKARKIIEEGGTPNVVGVDIEFEEPADKDVVVATDEQSPEEACAALLDHLVKTGALEPAAGN